MSEIIILFKKGDMVELTPEVIEWARQQIFMGNFIDTMLTTNLATWQVASISQEGNGRVGITLNTIRGDNSPTRILALNSYNWACAYPSWPALQPIRVVGAKNVEIKPERSELEIRLEEM